MQQILYHGSKEIVKNPEVREPNRTLDFGKGFYLTSSTEQAERWVKNHLDAEEIGYVNLYSIDLDALPTLMKVLTFNGSTEEWVDFVLNNRVVNGYTHDYDIVIGPVANDRVYAQFSLFEGGIISKETLIRELKAYKLVDQYLFHTHRSLEYLKYVDNYEVKK
ncbi:MAG: DUF3990 domain-containing protein [Muribaculaceae bacterium]